MPLRLMLIAATSLMMATALAQVSAGPSPNTAVQSTSAPAAKEKVVEGATADRVAQIERCQGHKFDSQVEIDPVRKRSTRVKLCANPGSSDADWVRTLEAAVTQIAQRDMPASAKEKLIGELRTEIAKFAQASKPAAIAQRAPVSLGSEAGTAAALISPTERYETSILPSLTPPKRAAAATAATGSSPPQRPMRMRLTCRERGQTGSGTTCDFIEPDTILAVSAVEGLEEGGTLRFQGRGDARGEVTLAPMQAGQAVRIKLPAELCRGFGNTRVEIGLIGPRSTGPVATRLGSYKLQC